MNPTWFAVIGLAAVVIGVPLWYFYFVHKSESSTVKDRFDNVVHIMVDLETFSLEPNAYIRSIGACSFDDSGVLATFYESCDGSEQVGADINDETIQWWERQSVVAQNVLANPNNNRLIDTLRAFTRWVADERLNVAMEKMPEVWVWGNGGDFDPVILANAMKRTGLPVPWKYHSVRCYRTIKNIFREVKADVFEGEKHDALADAMHQARHASAILKHIKHGAH